MWRAEPGEAPAGRPRHHSAARPGGASAVLDCGAGVSVGGEPAGARAVSPGTAAARDGPDDRADLGRHRPVRACGRGARQRCRRAGDERRARSAVGGAACRHRRDRGDAGRGQRRRRPERVGHRHASDPAVHGDADDGHLCCGACRLARAIRSGHRDPVRAAAPGHDDRQDAVADDRPDDARGRPRARRPRAHRARPVDTCGRLQPGNGTRVGGADSRGDRPHLHVERRARRARGADHHGPAGDGVAGARPPAAARCHRGVGDRRDQSRRGVGRIAATALGVAFLALLGNGLTLLNLSDFVITIVKGLVILAAALVDVWRRRHAVA